MRKTNIINTLLLIGLISACSGPGTQTTFYWEKDGYGAAQFGADHQRCMYDADWFPFDTNAKFFGPDTVTVLPKFEDTKGVWAYYEPFKGAQPVYVNYSMGDNTVREKKYRKCMHNLGYHEKYAPYRNRAVGTLKCDTLNCERNDYNDGQYREYVPR